MNFPHGSFSRICQVAPLPLCTPSYTWFLWSSLRLCPSNGISIGSSVFVGLTVVTNTQTDTSTNRPRHSVCSSRPCVWYALYGRESWHLQNKKQNRISIDWNNCFRSIFNCCQSVNPLQYFRKVLQIYYVIRQGKLLYWNKLFFVCFSGCICVYVCIELYCFVLLPLWRNKT